MKNLMISLKMMVVMTVLTGILYPVGMTLVSQVLFPRQANGSLLKKNNQLVGSSLIAQKFISPKYFWPRPSSIDYNALPSGGSNLSYSSEDLKKKVLERQSQGLSGDMLFASASGLDPDITPQSAMAQIVRVAHARNFDETQTETLKQLVMKQIQNRQFDFLGEERVNVLVLNIELDKLL